MNPQEVVQRFQAVKGNRYVVEDIWDSIEQYIAPYRGRFFKDERSENSVQWRRPFVYDATAIMASQNLASSLHSRLTSASSQWFGIKFRQGVLNDDQIAMEWLQECQALCFEALQESNFNVQINESYQDLVNYGTTVLIEEKIEDESDGNAKLNFKSVPIKECYFEEDHKGDVLNLYRHIQWTAKQILNFFGEENITKEIYEQATDAAADPAKKYDIVYCIYRRHKIPEASGAKVLAPDKRPWGWTYVLLNSAEELGEGGGFYEKPAFTGRWRKTSSSMWGNSPAMVALADTLTLNRTIELNLSAVEKALDPPVLTSSRGLIGDLDLSAGGLSVARDVKEVIPFQSGARFDVTYQEMNRLRENIESYFFIPQLILPPMQGTPATATEISVRMQQLEALIGATLARIQTDLLDPIITRTFGILFRSGRLPEMPQVVADEKGRLEIEYTSPIAKTQDASNVQAIERFLGMLLTMSEANQDLLAIPDWDETMKTLAGMLGVPFKILRNQQEVEDERNENRAAQQAMEQGAVMEQVGKGEQAMQEAQQQ